MRYMLLDPKDRTILLHDLREMPAFLRAAFGSLTDLEAATPGPDGAFSPVEHCWHLADLEREGYGVRIRRLRTEQEPALPDFDGTRIAEERCYRSRSLADGIAAFDAARAANIAILEALSAAEWSRAGTQEGVGPVSLCDIPAMMSEHDATHHDEIEQWLRDRT